jgi:hypothetical protein
MPLTGLKVILAGRPDPPIPEDVAPDHPVRTCRIRWLDVSPHATEIGRLARQELSILLSGDQLHRDLLGLITASGGGLTLGDLQELTGNAAYELESLFGGLLGRTLISQLDLDSRNPQRVFVFAHDTLREEAINRFGIALDRYRGRIHDWSRTYQQGGWPAKTPEYLLRAYPRMLRNEHDYVRLAGLATDTIRHDRLLNATGGDAAATAEIVLTQQLLLQRHEPSLSALGLLAVHRMLIARRSVDIPLELPVIWARLGHVHRGEALARGFGDPEARAKGLASVAYVLAGRDFDHYRALLAEAERVTENISDAGASARALAPVSGLVRS